MSFITWSFPIKIDLSKTLLCQIVSKASASYQYASYQ